MGWVDKTGPTIDERRKKNNMLAGWWPGRLAESDQQATDKHVRASLSVYARVPVNISLKRRGRPTIAYSNLCCLSSLRCVFFSSNLRGSWGTGFCTNVTPRSLPASRATIYNPHSATTGDGTEWWVTCLGTWHQRKGNLGGFGGRARNRESPYYLTDCAWPSRASESNCWIMSLFDGKVE